MKASSLLAPIAKRLEGKVAIITGGARGIGESAARLFVRHGAKVIIADIKDELGQALCKDMDNPNSLSFINCDVTKELQVKNLVDATVAKHGKLDIMYANAGISGDIETRILKTDDNDFKRVLDVNVFGSYLTAKHAARVMVPSKRGSIIFTSSVAALTSGDTSHAYTASKHAVVGLTKNLCVELGALGIRVNCISPFGVDTPMLREYLGLNDGEKVVQFMSEPANLKETVLEAEDVAAAALYLGSDEANYVSGLNLVLDGGYSTTNVALRETLKSL